jgi:1-deoxy-D-xylulose-5-phosphate reductoisomerase
MRGLVVLGSTGSIGRQTLDVVRAFPGEFKVVGLAAGLNLDLLASQIEEFKPRTACCALEDQRNLLPDGVEFVPMEDMVCQPGVELVMAATIGSAGLVPTIRALENGVDVALANKEVIIMAGDMIMSLASAHGAAVLPVDSEPSAIWQCLQGEPETLRRVIITASGGAFRDTPVEELETVTPEQALKHPTWKMGKKITVDSATLMNKAFEVIETHCLFNVPWDKIEVVVHPQSVIHSMVEMADGSMKAQLGPPDMRLPIQYAMFYPQRLPNPQIPTLDTGVGHALTFQPLEPERYPCFSLAVQAGKGGGTYPTVLSAADEVAVGWFLDGKLGFTDIQRTVGRVLDDHRPTAGDSLDDILEADRWARIRAEEVAGQLPGRPGIIVSGV